MRRNIAAVVMMALLASFSFGCGKSYDGNNRTVVNTVTSISRNVVRDMLAERIYMNTSGIPTSLLGYKVNYAALQKSAGSDKNAAQALKQVDEIMAKAKFTVKNIRVNKKDAAILKSFSRADLSVYNPVDQQTQTIPIQYTAQVTKEGVYVEVFGLK